MGLKILSIYFFLFSCSCFASSLVKDAKTLLYALTPESTNYQHGEQIVLWPDTASGVTALSLSDCSGFMNALLSKTYKLTSENILIWTGTKRPLAKTYHQMIVAENHFQKINKLSEIQKGDILAVLYRDGGETTGHVMLVTSGPIEVGLNDWSVEIIDSSKSGHGEQDTRYNPINNTYTDGLGMGHLRVFSNDQKEVIGYAWSFDLNSKRKNQSDYNMVIGRYDRELISTL